MRREILHALNVERAARRASILVTDTDDHGQRLVTESALAADPLAPILAEALRGGRSRLIAHEGRSLFLTVQVPPLRLVLVGAVHIAQALAPMARALDLDVTVIDPRQAFATQERFPGVALVVEWPDRALGALDRYSALAALTHDPKIDDPALIAALDAECLYVGALGSRRTHAQRVERLRAAGLTEEAIARIRAPIGLDIRAVSPAEIAVSILAELIATLRRGPDADG